MVKRAQTEPKAACAGAMVEISFAVVRTSMARFSLERVLSRPSCCWESEAITEGRGSLEGMGWAQALRKTRTPIRISWATSVQIRPFRMVIVIKGSAGRVFRQVSSAIEGSVVRVIDLSMTAMIWSTPAITYLTNRGNSVLNPPRPS